jgi:hypothetical protein
MWRMLRADRHGVAEVVLTAFLALSWFSVSVLRWLEGAFSLIMVFCLVLVIELFLAVCDRPLLSLSLS